MSSNTHPQTTPRRAGYVGAGLAALCFVVALFPLPATAAAATSTAPDAAAVADQTGYRISAEDLLDIAVWGEEELQRQVVVRPDGGISFPLVGNIRAAGKTPAELTADLTERLEEFVPGATVTVSVAEIRGMRIYVTGKVNEPGQFLVGRYVDVLQALTLAGGLTAFADEDDIRILRRDNGEEVVYEFDYGQVKRGRNLDQNIRLQADDVVVVP